MVLAEMGHSPFQNSPLKAQRDQANMMLGGAAFELEPEILQYGLVRLVDGLVLQCGNRSQCRKQGAVIGTIQRARNRFCDPGVHAVNPAAEVTSSQGRAPVRTPSRWGSSFVAKKKPLARI